jgi:DNA-directed RNA polymerase sigma subunit (sigma70/sigma32)
VRERAASSTGRVRGPLRLITSAAADITARVPQPESLGAHSGPQPLHSSRDAAISNLREQTMMALAMLTSTEQCVLQVRFGLGEPGRHNIGTSGHLSVLTPEQVLCIESRALRKLRHPNRFPPLRSVIRI